MPGLDAASNNGGWGSKRHQAATFGCAFLAPRSILWHGRFFDLRWPQRSKPAFAVPSQALYTGRCQAFLRFLTVKFLTRFRFSPRVIAAKRFSEKSRRPSSLAFRPCPLRRRCRFLAGALTFRVIGPRKRPFIFDGFFFGGSHTLFETVGKPKMRSAASCWPSKSRVPRKKFRPNRTGRFGAARLWNSVTPLSGCVSAALWLLSATVEMDLLGSLCSANVGPSPVVGESHRANRVWMWEKNKRVFSFRCQNGASEPKSDLL